MHGPEAVSVWQWLTATAQPQLTNRGQPVPIPVLNHFPLKDPNCEQFRRFHTRYLMQPFFGVLSRVFFLPLNEFLVLFSYLQDHVKL